jgi:hypothetical protein
MRHGTWVQTGGEPGGGGVGLIVAVIAGVVLAALTKPARHSAHTGPAAPDIAGLRVHAAAHTTTTAAAAAGGHGVGWWALLTAGMFTAVIVLAVAGLAVRERIRRQAVPWGHAPATPSPQPTGSGEGGPGDGAEVICLADYTASGTRRSRVAGGGAA